MLRKGHYFLPLGIIFNMLATSGKRPQGEKRDRPERCAGYHLEAVQQNRYIRFFSLPFAISFFKKSNCKKERKGRYEQKKILAFLKTSDTDNSLKQNDIRGM